MAQSLTDLTRRIFSLYLLATQLPKDLQEEEIQATVHAILYQIPPANPSMSQTLFAFLSGEMILITGHGIQEISLIEKSLILAYKEAKYLPKVETSDVDLFEIIIWKKLSEKYGLLEKMPYRIGQRIEEEIATSLIDNPAQNFTALVHYTIQTFLKKKELIKTKKIEELDRKVRLWCMQGDLLCRCVRFDRELPLLKYIQAVYEEYKTAGKILSSSEFVARVCQNYLQEHPHLISYANHLSQRVYTLYKYAWYTLFSSPEESSVDRFILWHKIHFGSGSSEALWKEKLASIFQQQLPLIPLDANKQPYS